MNTKTLVPATTTSNKNKSEHLYKSFQLCFSATAATLMNYYTKPFQNLGIDFSTRRWPPSILGGLNLKIMKKTAFLALFRHSDVFVLYYTDTFKMWSELMEYTSIFFSDTNLASQ